MSIKYEIHGIKNAKGEGVEQPYVHIFESEPSTDTAVEDDIQANCSLTKADLRAAFSALRERMCRDLAAGRRFHIPGVGYFSLSVALDLPDDKSIDKMRADYIRLRTIRFCPERALLGDVRSGVRFERSTFSSRSRQYSEAELLQRIRRYFATHNALTRRDMEREFGLRTSSAHRWLRRFTAMGVLKKEGAWNAPMYFLVE